jgi:hypothetical protein
MLSSSLNTSNAIRSIVVGATLALTGCGVLDDARDERKAKEAVARLLLDPSSAGFRNIDVRNGHVCGEVNGKNTAGAYVGFKRFISDTADWSARIDPQFSSSDLLEAEELCSSMTSNSYISRAATESACSRASEKRLEQMQQRDFDNAWQSKCGAVSQMPFQPSLAPISPDANASDSAPADDRTSDMASELPNLSDPTQDDEESLADEQSDNLANTDNDAIP